MYLYMFNSWMNHLRWFINVADWSGSTHSLNILVTTNNSLLEEKIVKGIFVSQNAAYHMNPED